METIDRQVRRKAKAMTRNEVMVRAIAGKLSWIQAADICGITPAPDATSEEALRGEGV